MAIFVREGVEAIRESAEYTARKHGIPPELFHCLHPYVHFSKTGYVAWQFVEQKGVDTDEHGNRFYWRYEPDEELRKLPNGNHLYLWAEVWALAQALLTEEMNHESQYVMYSELERKHALAEVNSFRGSKGSRSFDQALQNVIGQIVQGITEKTGKCSFSDLEAWLRENADGLETNEPDCDELTFVEGFGELTDPDKCKFRSNSITWFTSNGEQKGVAITSLKKYLTRAKKNME